MSLCVLVIQGLYVTLSSLLLMNGSWLIGGVFCEGIFGVMLLAGPLSPCWVRVGEIRSSVWKEVLMIMINEKHHDHHNKDIDQIWKEVLMIMIKRIMIITATILIKRTMMIIIMILIKSYLIEFPAGGNIIATPTSLLAAAGVVAG